MVKPKNFSINFKVNDEIAISNNSSVRIVGENIESKIVSFGEAKKIAESLELDLIEINSSSNPRVIKLCNFSKLLYEMKKNAKKNKQKTSKVKEIQLSVGISKHDLEIKAKKAEKFISDGDKVKVILTMKGRENLRKDENKKSILEFIVMCENFSSIDGGITDNGNKTIVILKKK